MSAMTVKVVTALNCSCAVADMAMSKVAKIAPIAATTFERPWFTGINASRCAFDFRSDKRVLPQMRTICTKVCSLSRPGVCQLVMRWRYGLEVRPGRGHAGAFWKRLGQARLHGAATRPDMVIAPTYRACRGRPAGRFQGYENGRRLP